MTDSTSTDDLDGEGTPMGEAEPIVRLPFAQSHHAAIKCGDKTATLRVDHSEFAAPGRRVELVGTDSGQVLARRTITATFRCRAYQCRQLLAAVDSARHDCLDHDRPINEELAPYYTDDISPATVVQGIVWNAPAPGE